MFFFFFLTKLISYILFKIVCVFHLTLLTSINIREEEENEFNNLLIKMNPDRVTLFSRIV